MHVIDCLSHKMVIIVFELTIFLFTIAMAKQIRYWCLEIRNVIAVWTLWNYGRCINDTTAKELIIPNTIYIGCNLINTMVQARPINDTTVEYRSAMLSGNQLHTLVTGSNHEQLSTTGASSTTVGTKKSQVVHNVNVESIPAGFTNGLKWHDIIINGSYFKFSDKIACVINNDIIYASWINNETLRCTVNLPRMIAPPILSLSNNSKTSIQQLNESITQSVAAFDKHFEAVNITYNPWLAMTNISPVLDYHSNITSNITVTGTNFVAGSTFCKIGNVVSQAVSVASNIESIHNVTQSEQRNFSIAISNDHGLPHRYSGMNYTTVFLPKANQIIHKYCNGDGDQSLNITGRNLVNRPDFRILIRNDVDIPKYFNSRNVTLEPILVTALRRYNLFVTANFNRIFLRYDSESIRAKKDVYFGFTEPYSFFNFYTKYMPILTSEQGVGGGDISITSYSNNNYNDAGGNWHTSYGSKPICTTNNNYSIVFKNYDIVTVDICYLFNNTIIIDLYSNSTNVKQKIMNARLIFGETPLDLVEKITLITGRMSPIPKWATKGGMRILGIEGGEDDVLNTALDLMLNYNISLSGIWLEDWVATSHFDVGGAMLLWNWELNSHQYPNWNNMLDTLKQVSINNFQVLTYINSFFANVYISSKLIDEFKHNYFEQGIKNGYFIKNSSNDTYLQYLIKSLSIEFATINLTNTNAIKWMKNIKQNMLNRTHVGGFKADFGEHIIFDGFVYNTSISSSDTINISSCICRMSLIQSDIGGYTMLNGADERRYAIDNYYRSHLGNIPSTSTQIWSNNKTKEHFCQFTGIFESLSYYKQLLMNISYEKGYSIVGHAQFHEPVVVLQRFFIQIGLIGLIIVFILSIKKIIKRQLNTKKKDLSR